MIIFGGEDEYKQKDNRRLCFNDIWFFDTTTNVWSDKTFGFRPK